MKRLLLALLLFAIPLQLQASVYWVKYDELADNVGTVDTYADPYGIKVAFGTAAAGDGIRIIQDTTNHYDSNTNSWTNRDADKSIATVNGGTADDPIVVTCWSDETTQVTTVGGCELDFNTGTGDGIVAEDINWIFQNLEISNATTHGYHIAGDNNLIYRCIVDGAGSTGIRNEVGAIRNSIVESVLHGNTTGVELEDYGFFYHNDVYGNTTGVGFIAGAWTTDLSNNLIYSNTGDGILVYTDFCRIVFNTIYANGGDNINMSTGSEGCVIAHNFLVGSTGGFGLNIGSGSNLWLVSGNNYYNNDSGARNVAGNIQIDEDSTPDVGAVTFVSATDLEVSSGGALSYTFPRGTTDCGGKKGAVQSDAASGGECSYAVAQ